MAAASPHTAAQPAGAPALGLGAIAAFTALPLAALAGVVALLLRHELPMAGTRTCVDTRQSRQSDPC